MRLPLRLAAGLLLLCPRAEVWAQADTALPEATAQVQAAVDAGQGASARTHAALERRRAMLLELMRTDPGSARGYALPVGTRQALLAADPGAAGLLEYELVKSGELTESVADSWTDDRSTTRYALHGPAGELDLSLPAGVRASVPGNHHLVTVRGLALGDVVAAERVTEASPEEATACALPVSSQAAAHGDAVGGRAAAAAATCSTVGNQRIAVLIVKFPAATPAFPAGLDQAAYWNQVLFGSNPSVNTYWQEVSQGQTYATGDVYGPFQLAAQYDCTTTSAMQTAAIAAAVGTVDFSRYNRVVVVYPVTSCTFGGLANVGCVSATTAIGHQYSVVWLPISPTYKADFSYPQMWGGTSHELGHNLGMNHANTLDFGALSLGPLDFSTTNPGTVNGTGSGTGTGSTLQAVNTEYGDNFDVMGYPWTAGGPYNAVHRAKTLGWIAGTDEQEVTAGGAYTLVPAENASGLRALHVLRDAGSAAWLWVEYHQAAGYYESGNFSAHAKYGDTETTGAQIHYEAPIGANAYTYLLDMTPAAVAGSNNFYDGTLAPGRSWSDPYSLLTLTAGGQTSAGLGITVSYDAPCAALALSSSSVPAAGGTGTLTITAPGSCSWTVSSNALWVAFPGATSGSGSAVIPFVAGANTSALQRNTFLTAQRQSVGLVQGGSAMTLGALTPNAGSSVAGAATAFTLAFADAAGASDLTQINLDFSGFGGSPDCQVAVVPVAAGSTAYLYLLANGAYTGGVAVGSSGTVTSPSCTLSAAASSYKTSAGVGGVTLGLTFTAAFLGEHNITASAYGNAANTGSMPLGVWLVNAQGLPSTVTTLLVAATAMYGFPLALTAGVTPGTATGAVEFQEVGGGAVATGTLSGGVAAASTSTLSAGVHQLVASYGGDGSYAGSASAPASVTVAQANSSTHLFVSQVLVSYGSSLTLSATVNPQGATGTVTFMEGTTVLGSAAVVAGSSAGTAALTLSSLGAGTHTLTAVYSGDGNVVGSSSPAVLAVVNPATTEVVLGASAKTVAAGASVTLLAAVTPALATGMVTFYDGTPTNAQQTALGTATLVNGVGTFLTSGLAVGTHTLIAFYGGDANDAGASSGFLPVVVTSVPGTTTTLAASATSLVPSGAVTLTAQVAALSGTAQPAGSVSFMDGGAVLGTAALSGGAASFTASGLGVGTHALRAVYGGSTGAFGGSASEVVPVTVAKLTTSFAVSGSSATVFAGGAVVLSAAPVAPAGAQTAGTMTFTDGGLALGTVAVPNGGAASFTVTGLAAGMHSFGAVYSGSGDLAGASGSPFPVAVQDFAMSLLNGSTTLTAGTSDRFPVTVTPGVAGFASTVGLTCSGVPALATCTVTPGAVTPGGGTAAATVTLTTTARPKTSAGWLLLALGPLLMLRRRAHLRVLAGWALLGVLLAASGCGQGNFGVGPEGTPAGTYGLTITGTATAGTSLVHATTLTLTVN